MSRSFVVIDIDALPLVVLALKANLISPSLFSESGHDRSTTRPVFHLFFPYSR